MILKFNQINLQACLYTTYNYIHQYSYLISNSEKYTIPKITIFLKMHPLYFDTSQAVLDHFYSKQEAMKISEAMDTPHDQISDKQQIIFIGSLSN